MWKLHSYPSQCASLRTRTMPTSNLFNDVYKRALQVYANDPSEERKIVPIHSKNMAYNINFQRVLYGTGIFFYLFASIDKTQLPSPLLVWEIVAVTTTGLLLFLHFGDLYKQSNNGFIDHSMASVYIGLSVAFNALCLVFAILFLTKLVPIGGDVKTHMCYFVLIVMSFASFVVLDYYFAHNVRDFKKTRECHGASIFCRFTFCSGFLVSMFL